MGSEIWEQLGVTRSALLPSDIDLSVANSKPILLCSMAHLELIMADNPGENYTKELVYITRIKRQSLLLSLAALRRLKSINGNFPRPVANQLNAASTGLAHCIRDPEICTQTNATRS